MLQVICNVLQMAHLEPKDFRSDIKGASKRLWRHTMNNFMNSNPETPVFGEFELENACANSDAAQLKSQLPYYFGSPGNLSSYIMFICISPKPIPEQEAAAAVITEWFCGLFPTSKTSLEFELNLFIQLLEMKPSCAPIAVKAIISLLWNSMES